MWPDWLLEKVANGEVTVNQVIWILSAIVTLVWCCQAIRPIRQWYKDWWKRK